MTPNVSVARGTSCAPDFRDLTEAQQRMLSFGGWAPGSRNPQPRPQTARKLLERGLIVQRDVKFMGVQIKAYEVPAAIHAAWCARCAQLDKARAA